MPKEIARTELKVLLQPERWAIPYELLLTFMSDRSVEEISHQVCSFLDRWASKCGRDRSRSLQVATAIGIRRDIHCEVEICAERPKSISHMNFIDALKDSFGMFRWYPPVDRFSYDPVLEVTRLSKKRLVQFLKYLRALDDIGGEHGFPLVPLRCCSLASRKAQHFRIPRSPFHMVIKQQQVRRGRKLRSR